MENSINSGSGPQGGHASLEQLLEIKDGVENELSLHVQQCSVCQAELASYELIAQKLVDSADTQPSEDLWFRIAARAQNAQFSEKPSTVSQFGGFRQEASVPPELVYQSASGGTANASSLNRAIYTLAASVLFTGIVGLFIFGQQGSSQQQNAQMQASIQQLMLNSRGMELALQKVAMQSDLLSSAEKSTADRLYWQLAMLDQSIQSNTENNDSDPQILETLWNDRIDALNALNQLYYQRQQSMTLSEI